MILGSHNSWSFHKTRLWLLRPFVFTAKCQSCDIKAQYELGVRCFDLRVRFKNGKVRVAHGAFVYKVDFFELMKDLDFINKQGDCYVRVIHEVRTRKQDKNSSIFTFRQFCKMVERGFPQIKFWCGRNLYNWGVDYYFENNPSCEEKYSSVCKPKLIDDWFPCIYAKLHNRENIKKGTDKKILLIDFVNIK